MFKIIDGESIPLGFSYSICAGRSFMYFKFPIWVSKKKGYAPTKDTFLFGWKLKVILFKLMFACGDQNVGEQVDIGIYNPSKIVLNGQLAGEK